MNHVLIISWCPLWPGDMTFQLRAFQRSRHLSDEITLCHPPSWKTSRELLGGKKKERRGPKTFHWASTNTAWQQRSIRFEESVNKKTGYLRSSAPGEEFFLRIWSSGREESSSGWLLLKCIPKYTLGWVFTMNWVIWISSVKRFISISSQILSVLRFDQMCRLITEPFNWLTDLVWFAENERYESQSWPKDSLNQTLNHGLDRLTLQRM